VSVGLEFPVALLHLSSVVGVPLLDREGGRLGTVDDVIVRLGEDDYPREAPVFVGVITVLLAVGTAVAMIPGIPVFSLLILVQAVNGVLLPVTLFFVWRLASSQELMGDHRNGRAFNVLAGATVIATSTLSILLLAVTIGGVSGL
jgi:Mn2+/Fe2+ NRAMP family transporter